MRWDREFYLQVAKGKVPGHTLVHKFGAETVGTTLVPVCASGFYRTPTAATTLEVISDTAADCDTGTGARELTIQGIGAGWVYAETTVIPNGTTAVEIDTDFLRIFRWYVSSSGTYATQSAGSHAGTLTIRESGGGDTWSEIGVDPLPLGQSEIGAYPIPTEKKGYVISMGVYVDSVKSIDALFFQRPNADDVTSPYGGAFRLVERFAGVDRVSTIEPKSPWGPFVGPCDIGFMAKVGTGTGFISVSFEILIVDNAVETAEQNS